MHTTAGTDLRRRAVVALAATTALIAIAITQADSRADEQARQTPAVNAPAAAAYAALSRPAAPADKAESKPGTLQQVAAEIDTMIPDAARVLVDTPNETVALVPAKNGELCFVYFLANGEGGANCNTNGIAHTQGLSLYRPGWGIGVVPDGVTHVAFTLKGGSVTRVAVENNVYHAPSDATSARIESGGGVYTTAFMPK